MVVNDVVQLSKVTVVFIQVVGGVRVNCKGVVVQTNQHLVKGFRRVVLAFLVAHFNNVEWQPVVKFVS